MILIYKGSYPLPLAPIIGTDQLHANALYA